MHRGIEEVHGWGTRLLVNISRAATCSSCSAVDTDDANQHVGSDADANVATDDAPENPDRKRRRI